MIRRLKHAVRRLLAARGYSVSWSLPWQIAGVHLEADLPRIIDEDNPIILDVGANVGQTVDLMLKLFPNAKILAFEPASESFTALTAHYGDRCQRILKIALGDEDGVQTFTKYSSPEYSSLHAFHPDASQHEGIANIQVVGSEEVTVRTLESLWPELGVPRIDLLKIDTQGHDLAVLRGAGSLLRSGLIGAVLVEVIFLNMYSGEGSWLQISHTLESAGYRVVDFYEKHRAGHLLSWCNCLFVREPSRSRSAN
jgi:FkbM family methyltransferase